MDTPLMEHWIRWIIFSVSIALLPLLFRLLSNLGKGLGPDFCGLFSHGELLLISAAICAGALGDLVGTGTSLSLAKVVSGGACVVLLMLASLWFADIWSARGQSTPITLNERFIARGSIVIFACSVATSSCCVVLGRL